MDTLSILYDKYISFNSWFSAANSTVAVGVGAVGILALSRLLFDSYYFIRFLNGVIFGSLRFRLQGKTNLTDPVRISVRVLTTDLDHMGHMNNSRYNRECDFGRKALLLSSGVLQFCHLKRYKLSLAAITIRFRKSMDFLNTAWLVSKVVYWDDRSFYIEHSFLRKSDDFVYATAYAKLTFSGLTMQQFLESFGYEGQPPEPSADLLTWLKYNQESSDRLRPKTA